jgi:molybdopterin biosynthesis enzyme
LRAAGEVIGIKQFTPRRGAWSPPHEIYAGRIKDKFGPVVMRKLLEYDSEVFEQIFLPDDRTASPRRCRTSAKGAELIVVTGGMSWTPTTLPGRHPTSRSGYCHLRRACAPGSDVLVLTCSDIPVLGLPGCVMYSKRTIFDLVLPRVMAGERIAREE